MNLLVDHAESTGAPVVFEDLPTQPNLLGRVEHAAQFGALVTDFTPDPGRRAAPGERRLPRPGRPAAPHPAVRLGGAQARPPGGRDPHRIPRRPARPLDRLPGARADPARREDRAGGRPDDLLPAGRPGPGLPRAVQGPGGLRRGGPAPARDRAAVRAAAGHARRAWRAAAARPRCGRRGDRPRGAAGRRRRAPVDAHAPRIGPPSRGGRPGREGRSRPDLGGRRGGGRGRPSRRRSSRIQERSLEEIRARHGPGRHGRGRGGRRERPVGRPARGGGVRTADPDHRQRPPG